MALGARNLVIKLMINDNSPILNFTGFVPVVCTCDNDLIGYKKKKKYQE